MVNHGEPRFRLDCSDQIAAENESPASSLAGERPGYGRVGQPADRNIPPSCLACQSAAHAATRGHVRTVEQAEPFGVLRG
jgi:hypothetical protein